MFARPCSILALLVCSTLALMSAADAQTERHVQTNGIDAGNCTTYPCASIGYALSQSASGDRIMVAAGLFNEMVTIDRNIEIVGAGADLTMIEPTLSAGNSPEGRVFTISSGIVVTLAHLTTRRGAASANNDLSKGGCIHSRAHDLSLINMVVRNCFAISAGSGIYQDGGHLRLRNVVLRNTGPSWNSGSTGGGLYASAATVTATNVTIANNYATTGAGIYLASGSLTLSNSILGVNSGPEGSGRQIYNASGSPVIIRHSVYSNDPGFLSGPGGFSIDSESFAGSPGFMDDSIDDPDFSLRPDSPAINRGRNQFYTDAGGNLVNDTDVSGNPRLYPGGNIDIGAYEYQGAPIDLSPPPLRTPAHDAYPIPRSGGRLVWLARPDADSYEVQLAPITHLETNPFTNLLLDTITEELSVDLPILTYFRMYEWRVRAWHGDFHGDWSEVRRFTTESRFQPSADNILYVGHGGIGGGIGSQWGNRIPTLADALKWAHLHRNDGLWSADAPLQIWVTKDFQQPFYRPDNMVGPFGSHVSTYLMVPNVQVYGGFAGHETSPDERNLQVNRTRLGNFGYHHNVISAGDVGVARLDGFLIDNGSATGSLPIEVNGYSIDPTMGGGIYLVDSSPVLANLVITNNQATSGGGGIFISGGQPRLVGLEVTNNQSGEFGAGIFNVNGQVTLINSLLAGNSGSLLGGGIMNSGGQLHLVNSTIAGNQANEGGGLWHVGTTSTIHNTIIWGNQADVGGRQFHGVGNALTHTELDHVLIANEPGAIVEGDTFNLGAALHLDPLFIQPDEGDFRLADSSPAIDFGNTALYAAAGGDPATDHDLAGAPRVQGAAIDPGAFETQGAPPDQIFHNRFQ